MDTNNTNIDEFINNIIGSALMAAMVSEWFTLIGKYNEIDDVPKALSTTFNKLLASS